MQACEVILSNKGRFAFEQIKDDPIIFYGFVKQVEIIGEAVYMLSKEYREQHTEVEWRVIESMRHVLVHGYYAIEPRQLWETVESDIPVLYEQMKKLLQEEPEQ